ncbi:hypothetical protein Bca4012_020141 [Brassica carinata]|uniref:Uncharacterized protein n=1 Tax=Brassica carinata TaxID=52824 RepID=A0A8X7WHE0_BRACI|nr:hypothetical protein Bca52824_001436 [Brassica carinata]
MKDLNSNNKKVDNRSKLGDDNGFEFQVHWLRFSQAPVRHQLLRTPVKLVYDGVFKFLDDRGCGFKLVDDGGSSFR